MGALIFPRSSGVCSHPFVPLSVPRFLRANRDHKLQESSHIFERTHETKAYPNNSQFPAHLALQIFQCDSGFQHSHIVLDAKKRRSTTWITNTPRTKRNFLLGCGEFDKGVWDHSSVRFKKNERSCIPGIPILFRS